MKKNYLLKNLKDEKIIFYEILKIFNKLEKIKKKDEYNIAGVLFHELMLFFVSNRCQKNSRIALNDKNYFITKFGKRGKKSIIQSKKNSFFIKILYKLYSIFSLKFKFKKKLLIGKSISLSLKNKIILVLFCLFHNYRLTLVNFDCVKIILSKKLKIYFLEEIKKLLIKYKIDLKNLEDLKMLLKNITTNNDYLFNQPKKSIIISGTLGNIENRLLAIKKNKVNAKLLVVNHLPAFGFVSYRALKYDEFYLTDYYLTTRGNKISSNDNNYLGIDNKGCKILSLEKKYLKYSSNYVKKIDLNNLAGKKILYIPARVVGTSLLGDFLKSSDYENWQDFLSKQFKKIDIKLPHKEFHYKKNNNFNNLDPRLKLVEICKKYDLIILDYISSSTFAEVANTEVPILYFNLGRDHIRKNIKKLILSRIIEIKINIFNDYKGFEKINNLKLYNNKKNNFINLFSKMPNQQSFYQNLVDIDKKF